MESTARVRASSAPRALPQLHRLHRLAAAIVGILLLLIPVASGALARFLANGT